MVLESTVKGGRKEGNYFLVMDEKVDDLRKAVWATIHEFSGEVKKADVGMALGIVQYELLHHNEKEI